MDNVFNLLWPCWFVVETSTRKIQYCGSEFNDYDTAVMALSQLAESNPEKDYELLIGGYSVEKY